MQPIRLVFQQDGVVNDQTDVQLNVTEVTSAAANAVQGYVMPFAGTIVGVSADLSAAASAGQLTVGATIDGTEDSSTTLTVTDDTNSYTTVERGVSTFSAGAVIGCEITTSNTWDGTTSDLVATVWVLVEPTSI